MEKDSKNKRPVSCFDQRRRVCWWPKVWWFEIKTTAPGLDVETERLGVYVEDSDT